MLLIAGMSLLPVAHASAAEGEDVEDTVGIHLIGQLIELSSTEAPTTIIVRENPAGEFMDYTVDITESTVFGANIFNQTVMDDWLNGDILNIQGTKNVNTGVVTANVIINSTMSPSNYRGLNGWIDSIDESASQVVVQWNGELHTVNVTENTHMVVGQTNPAAISDLEVGDRVRVRILKNSDVENEARVIFVLRRGPRIFQLARTRGFHAELNEIDGENNEMNVTLLVNPQLRDGDVNNLVGTEGAELTVTWDDYTKFVRRYRGESSEDELTAGDHLFIVGRVNDDGTISARLIKDNSIFRAGVSAHVGTVVSIDTEANVIEVDPAMSDRHWTISYTDETTLYVGREEAREDEIAPGMLIRVRGVANVQLGTVDAFAVSAWEARTERLERREARISEVLEEIAEYEDAE